MREKEVSLLKIFLNQLQYDVNCYYEMVLRNNRKKVKIKTNNSEHNFFIALFRLESWYVESGRVSSCHQRRCSSVKREDFFWY